MRDKFNLMEEFEKNPALFIKFFAPILLAVSFGLVFVMWIQLEADAYRQMPIVKILTVPLILFGTMAIINIMLFVDSNPTIKFLAIFFIGAVFSTSEVTNLAGKFLNYGYSSEHTGSINSSFYKSTGYIESETDDMHEADVVK